MAQHMLLHVEDIGPVSTPILHINAPHAETKIGLYQHIIYVSSHEVMLLHITSQHTTSASQHISYCASTLPAVCYHIECVMC